MPAMISPDLPAFDATAGEQGHRAVGVGGRDDGEHAHAHVEGGLHVALLDAALALDQVEDGLRVPRWCG